MTEEYNVLTVEIELISTVADPYIAAAKLHDVDEGDIIAKILEVVANNEGMIDALLDDNGGWNDSTSE